MDSRWMDSPKMDSQSVPSRSTSGEWIPGAKPGGAEGSAELPTLTPSQRLRAQASLDSLQSASDWSGDLPVLLLDRCWLRLTVLSVEQLAVAVPPDLSWSAPELERYRQLLKSGCPSWQAQQLCWLEFGQEACQQALRRLWQAQEHPRCGWLLKDYLDFLTEYRHRFTSERPRPLPLLVLARSSGRPGCAKAIEEHGLFWLRPDLHIDERAMRHTWP
ncbi:MAG: hypothetical protein RLZZ609_200 [Cyanobacteriota bacterium]